MSQNVCSGNASTSENSSNCITFPYQDRYEGRMLDVFWWEGKICCWCHCNICAIEMDAGLLMSVEDESLLCDVSVNRITQEEGAVSSFHEKLVALSSFPLQIMQHTPSGMHTCSHHHEKPHFTASTLDLMAAHQSKIVCQPLAEMPEHSYNPWWSLLPLLSSSLGICWHLLSG